MKQIDINDQQYIHEIAHLHAQLLGDDPTTPVTPSRLQMSLYEEMINQRLQYSKEYILVEESQRAHLTAYIWAHYDQPLKQVVIESLFVHPSYRSNGVATRLKKEVEEWAKSVGAEQLVGTVRMDNHAMIELNTQLGYKKEKIVMAKRIEG